MKKYIVLTGGPGSGKTALMEMARKYFAGRMDFLPEAASIIFSGGFPRIKTPTAIKATQKAILQVQRELESIAQTDFRHEVILCDRGTLDGLAYWPGTDAEFFTEMNIDRISEMKRYSLVIHMRCPSEQNGYNHQNPARVESAHEAAMIDQKILKVWEGHPYRIIIDSAEDFLEKAARAIYALQAEINKEEHIRA